MVVVMKWLLNDWLSPQQVVHSTSHCLQRSPRLQPDMPVSNKPFSVFLQKPRGNNTKKATHTKKVSFVFIPLCSELRKVHTCLCFVLSPFITHIRKGEWSKYVSSCGRGGLVPEVLESVFFNLPANFHWSELLRYWEPEPQVIQFGGGIQSLISSHTFLASLFSETAERSKCWYFDSRLEISLLEHHCNYQISVTVAQRWWPANPIHSVAVSAAALLDL